MHLRLMAILALFSSSALAGQESYPHFFAIGAGYLRVYDGGGVALHAEYNRRISRGLSVGLPVILGWSQVAGNPGKRRSFMTGVHLRAESTRSTQASRYVAASVLGISSSVPDYFQAALAAGPFPTHNVIGNQWGYGLALNAGLGLAGSRKVRVTLDGGVIYQRVYDQDSDLGWMLGGSLFF